MLRRSTFLTTGNYLAALAAESAAPVLRVAARARARGPAAPPSSWRRGLIIGHTHIGDVLYRTPSLGPLREALPDCAWDYLAAPLSAPLLRGNPYVARVLPVNTGDRTWQLAPGGYAALSSGVYDVALCTNSTGHAPDFLLAASLGIPNRVGFTYKGLSALVTHPVEIPYPAPFPAYFQAMVAQLAARAPDWPLTPELYLDASDEAEAERVWTDWRLDAGEPPIACTLTTRQRAPWPPEHLLEPLRVVQAETGAEIVLCGAPGERDFLTRAARDVGLRARVLAGQVSLRGFAAFVRRCRALVASDSGPRHIGNAVGTPVAFAPNLAAIRAETGRYCDNEIDLGPEDECLTPPQVAAALARHSPREMARRILDLLEVRGPARPTTSGGAGQAC